MRPLAGIVLFLTTRTVFSEFNQTWSYTQLEGSNITFECEDYQRANSSVVWILPNETEVSQGWNDTNIVILGLKGENLYINNVNKETSGLYHCSYTFMDEFGNKTTFFIKRAVNLYGPEYPTLFDAYRTKIITAVIVTVVFLTLATTSCLGYEIYYQKHLRRIGYDESQVTTYGTMTGVMQESNVDDPPKTGRDNHGLEDDSRSKPPAELKNHDVEQDQTSLQKETKESYSNHTRGSSKDGRDNLNFEDDNGTQVLESKNRDDETKV